MISLSFHEFAHAYAANRAGDPTARLMGRMTLNPIVHVDPIGMIFFVVSFMAGVGFGWAKPVPVNPLNFRNMRKDDIIVSFAGVVANAILIVAGIVLMKILILAGFFHMSGGAVYATSNIQHYIWRIMIQFLALNTILVVFNLMPIPPLDGSKILMMLLPRESAMMIQRIEPFGFLIILVLLMSGVLDFIFGIAWAIIHSIAFFVFAL